MVSLEDIQQAQDAVYGVAVRTPLLRSVGLSERFGADVWLKAECLQYTGSFKIRGAANKLASLTAAERARGVVAASAGNHAQGVAVAARQLGVKATVLMPEHATLAKVQATRAYGAEVILDGDDFAAAMVRAQTLAKERDLVFIPAYDDEQVIAGQGTIGLEIADECPEAGLVVVPVGGGGLITGVALALKSLRPGIRVAGVQAAAAPGAAMSLQSGIRTLQTPKPTLADGVAISGPGELTLPLIATYVDEVVTVDEEAIAQAIVVLLEQSKLVVEGAGALGVAALMTGAVKPEGRPTVVVLSGGNIDINVLASVVQHGLLYENRYLTLRVDLDDRPGTLSALLTLIADTGANVRAGGRPRAPGDTSASARRGGTAAAGDAGRRAHRGAIAEADRSGLRADGIDGYCAVVPAEDVGVMRA
jgi:threonine dehydratase